MVLCSDAAQSHKHVNKGRETQTRHVVLCVLLKPPVGLVVISLEGGSD